MRRFFHLHHDSEEQRAAAEQEQANAARSLELLEAGNLPLRAQERLARRAVGDRPPIWSSDLSVGEYLSARTLRFEPLGQVLGASIYHMAYNVMNTQQYGDGELSTFSQAMYEARDRALNRMRQEAALLGAHGVIGVRLEQKTYDWGSNLIDLVAMGTAVRLPGAAPLKEPFLSDLSGQETLLLLRAGYVPVSLALGCCAYYVYTTWEEERRMHGWGSWCNQEMKHFTDGVYHARHLAIRRMADEGRRLGAEGIVGSDVELHVHEVHAQRVNPYSSDNSVESIEDHVVTFTVVGTAVAAIGHGHMPPDVPLVLDVAQQGAITLQTAPSGAHQGHEGHGEEEMNTMKEEEGHS